MVSCLVGPVVYRLKAERWVAAAAAGRLPALAATSAGGRVVLQCKAEAEAAVIAMGLPEAEGRPSPTEAVAVAAGLRIPLGPQGQPG